MLERSSMETAGGNSAIAREAEQALHFKNRARRMLDGGSGLSDRGEALLLALLRGPARPQELSEWLGCEPGAVSSMLDRMRRAGRAAPTVEGKNHSSGNRKSHQKTGKQISVYVRCNPDGIYELTKEGRVVALSIARQINEKNELHEAWIGLHRPGAAGQADGAGAVCTSRP